MDTHRTIHTVPLEGGHLALDFANTTGGLRDVPPEPGDELLRSYEDLLAWSVRADVLDAAQVARLGELAAGDARAGRRALRSAMDLRAAIYAAFRALADGRQPDPEVLARLLDADREALRHARLAPGEGTMAWAWPRAESLAAPLWPVAHAAVDLLTRGPLDRVKVCANCRWLFLDHSRNRSRRWCAMDQCGTQLKQRRFVERRRRARTAG